MSFRFNKYHKNYDRIVQVMQKEKLVGWHKSLGPSALSANK